MDGRGKCPGMSYTGWKASWTAGGKCQEGLIKFQKVWRVSTKLEGSVLEGVIKSKRSGRSQGRLEGSSWNVL